MKMKKKKTIRLMSEATQKKLLLKCSDLCFDLIKLVFGGVILAGIMGKGIKDSYLFGFGAISMITLLLFAFVLFALGNKSKKKGS